MNTEEFDNCIKNSKYSNGSLAEALGISRSALYRKKNGISEFTVPEMNLICELLKLTSAQKSAIFYKRKVSKKTL